MKIKTKGDNKVKDIKRKWMRIPKAQAKNKINKECEMKLLKKIPMID